MKFLKVYKVKNKKIRLSKFFSSLLKSKQILQFLSGGLKNRQFFNICKTCKGDFFFVFLKRLEFRIDAILLKVGFALTGKQIQQFLLHKHVFINFRRAYSGSSLVKKFDLISLNKGLFFRSKDKLTCQFFKTVSFLTFLRQKKPSIRKKLKVQSAHVYAKFPNYLETNYRIFITIVLGLTNSSQIRLPRLVSRRLHNQLYFIL